MQDREKVGTAIMLHKKEEAKQTKFMAQQQKSRYAVQQDMQRKERALKNRIMKEQERMQRAKVDEFRKAKIEAARDDIARKIAEEEEVIKQKEQEVIQMEMLEMELIKKLQNTQAIQKQAYTELEHAINEQRTVMHHAPNEYGQ